jgi:hypothetical protein
MTVKLVLNDRGVKALVTAFGSENITILGSEGDGYSYVSFEVKNDMDVLSVFHAGCDSGLELGLYGTKGKPVEEAKDSVELERG